MRTIIADSADVGLNVFIQDSSSVTGTGLTGLVYNTAGLTCYFRRGNTGTVTALTLVTLANAQAAHADGGFIEIDATNMPGWYRLDLSDAIVASGVTEAAIQLKGAANMAPVNIGIEIVEPVALADILEPFTTDARAEPSATPASNAAALAKLDYLYMLARNKMDKDSATGLQQLYADDGTTVVSESTISTASTTTTRTEMADP